MLNPDKEQHCDIFGGTLTKDKLSPFAKRNLLLGPIWSNSLDFSILNQGPHNVIFRSVKFKAKQDPLLMKLDVPKVTNNGGVEALNGNLRFTGNYFGTNGSLDGHLKHLPAEGNPSSIRKVT